MVNNSWRSKAPAMFVVALLMGWVLADAMNLRLPTDRRIPTVDELLANDADFASMQSMLRSTGIRDKHAADLMAACLLHDHPQLRQAARSVAHDRLDEWQLDSPNEQQQLVPQLSRSIKLRLLNTGGDATLAAEGREIIQRILRMTQRQDFADRKSCEDDCLAALNFAQPPVVATAPSSALDKPLRESIVAPVNFEDGLDAQKPRE